MNVTDAFDQTLEICGDLGLKNTAMTYTSFMNALDRYEDVFVPCLREQTQMLAEEVGGACEILGFDPLYVANEGKCLAIVAPEIAAEALELWRAHPLGRDAADVGELVGEHPGRVFLKSSIGGLRVVDMLSGEQLPRIC